MIKITIGIDVKNPKEVAMNHGIPGFVPNELIKGKVEDEIKNEIVKKLKVAIFEELRRNGVESRIDIR
ncbi:hypothetical protein [Clostridium sp. YIM B02551]|uniref:hypothetical protein n=1 Tax=Clostridium sp. YIM B02551 TaxID=2910679 RepID=UPI001EEB044A|nr:hypothetical protein [Clostridium sp. YIM B02551]